MKTIPSTPNAILSRPAPRGLRRPDDDLGLWVHSGHDAVDLRSRRGFGMGAIALAAGAALPMRANAVLPTTAADLLMPGGYVWTGWTAQRFVDNLRIWMPLLHDSIAELHNFLWPTSSFAQWWGPVLTRFNVAIGISVVRWTSAPKPTINFSGTVVSILQDALRAWLSVASEQYARKLVGGRYPAAQATAGSIVASVIMLAWQFSISKILGDLFQQGETGRRKLLTAPGDLNSLKADADRIGLSINPWRDIQTGGTFLTLSALSRQGRSATVRGNLTYLDSSGVHAIPDPGLVYTYSDGTTSRIVCSTVLDPAYPYR